MNVLEGCRSDRPLPLAGEGGRRPGEGRDIAKLCPITLLFAAALAFAFASALDVNAAPRIRHTINEQWRYAAGPLEGAERPDFDDRTWERVNLPHTWNAVDAFVKTRTYRRGIGWYRKSLSLDPAWRGKRIFLYFEGANQVADLFVNGRHAGQHIGGYTAFVFDITDHARFDGSNILAVRVDNAHNPDIPPLNADFTFYGGIYRDVWLIATSPIHVTVTGHASPGIFITTPTVSEERAVVRVSGTITNESDRTARVRVVQTIVDADGVPVASGASTIRTPAGALVPFAQTLPPVTRPRLWSPRTPYLYRLRTELYDGPTLLDRVENPLGFRWFDVDAENGFSLNGKPLRLFGTNRHQDHEGFGNALPDSLHRRDVRLIKENGFNFLRLAHYPQDPAVLDEADRLGLVIWEEIPVVNMIGTSPAFAENSERMLVEMIRQHFNHPSIVFWGYMNEVLLIEPKPVPDRYYEIVPELTGRLENRARAEDPSRKTVMALSRDEIHNDRGIADIPHVLGLNLYFGWYYEQLDSLGPFLDDLRRRRPARPLIVSEYGADNDERVHTFQPKAFDFSSEYEQVFHAASFPQLEARSFVMGTAVWNQFDFGSAGRQDTKFALNQKGLYFYDRTPKDIAFYYRAALLAEPVLYIAREWSIRAGSRVEDRRQPVWVYTNASQIELFVNGRSAGSRQVQNRTARWDVELVDGANRIRAVAGSIHDEITVSYTERVRGSFFAVNAGADYAHVDVAQVYWESDRAYEKGSWGYIGGSNVRTHHRIFSTSEDPLFQASRVAMDRYQFDVADGIYEVTLGFAEARGDVAPGQHVFTVRVNEQEMFRHLDLMKDYGAYTAVTRTMTVEAEKSSGICIEFEAKSGQASIASIQVRRIEVRL